MFIQKSFGSEPVQIWATSTVLLTRPLTLLRHQLNARNKCSSAPIAHQQPVQTIFSDHNNKPQFQITPFQQVSTIVNVQKRWRNCNLSVIRRLITSWWNKMCNNHILLFYLHPIVKGVNRVSVVQLKVKVKPLLFDCRNNILQPKSVFLRKNPHQSGKKLLRRN